MNEFINEFGKTNFIIMITIILLVMLALIIILIIENRNSKKQFKEDTSSLEDNAIKEETTIVVESKKDDNNEVFYVDHQPTKEEAKEKLEAVTKKLIEDDLNLISHTEIENKQEDDLNLISHTEFENKQEEESVISYEELLKASENSNNDKYMEDEERSAITIEELYEKYEKQEEKIDNPIFEEGEDTKRFRNSDVISPVFGVYKSEEKIYKQRKEKAIKDGPKELEEEIRKTEEFLEQLRKLKSKLQ